MTNVFCGVGSNIGDREKYIADALGKLIEHPGIVLLRQSTIFESEPMGFKAQPDFLNCVIEFYTTLDPLELLRTLQGIEKSLGRKRVVKWGPRTIDLDILLYGDMMINLASLVAPHPRLSERNFVLLPLNELASNTTVPGKNRTVCELLAECPDDSEISIYTQRRPLWSEKRVEKRETHANAIYRY